MNAALHRAGPFSAFEFRFELVGNDLALVEELARMLGGLRADATDSQPTEVHVLRNDTRLRLLIDGEQRFETGNAAVLIHHLIWEITRRAIASSRAALVLHAGAVRFGDEVVLVAGRSGAGKSTTIAALVAEGGSYLSDEAVALDRDGCIVRALARPMQLDARSHELLGIDREGSGHVQPDGSSYVTVDAELVVESIPPRRVVIIALDRSAAGVMSQSAAPSDLLAALMRQAFEPGRRTQLGLTAASALVTASTTRWISGGTPRERVDAIGEILESIRTNLVCDHAG